MRHEPKMKWTKRSLNVTLNLYLSTSLTMTSTSLKDCSSQYISKFMDDFWREFGETTFEYLYRTWKQASNYISINGALLCTELIIVIGCSGGSRIFPRGGREHAKFSRKLHEIERIWTPRGGRASLTPPLDPPMGWKKITTQLIMKLLSIKR